MTHDSATLAALRKRIAVIERRGAGEPARTAMPMPVGHRAIDAVLCGGIEPGKLHEIMADAAEDAGSAAGFATMLLLRVARPGSPIMWLREDVAQQRGGGLYGCGLAELGFDPARLVLGVLPDAVSLLRAAAEVARCPAIGGAVIELWRMPRVLDLTASRRLAVAAEASGVTLLLLRVDAEEAPSAARTRWRVRAAAARPLEANAPGLPALEIDLLRQRGGWAGGRWIVEWDRDEQCFRDAASNAEGNPRAGSAALSGAVVSVAARRPAAAKAQAAG